MVLAILEKFAGCTVQAEGDLFARHIAGLVNGLQDHLQGCLVAGHIRGKAALVADSDAHPFVMQNFLQCMKDLGAIANRLSQARRPNRNDHEFLQVQVVVGVRAAIDHIHHGDRHLHAAGPTEIAV